MVRASPTFLGVFLSPEEERLSNVNGRDATGTDRIEEALAQHALRYVVFGFCSAGSESGFGFMKTCVCCVKWQVPTPTKNTAAWEEKLQNVVCAVKHDLTSHAIKERVDLFMVYFWQQDNVNLRK